MASGQAAYLGLRHGKRKLYQMASRSQLFLVNRVGSRGKVIDTDDDTPSWVVNPYIWWRHPDARIFITFVILCLDFFIFGEDPIQESHVEYTCPGLGHMYSLLLDWPEELSLRMLRVAIIVTCISLSAYVSRQWVHHRLFRDTLKLTMFEDNKGAFFVMLAGEGLALMFVCPFVYNLCVSGNLNEPLNARTFRPFNWWGNVWQRISVSLDILTILSVTDMVLQDKHLYPEFAGGAKKLWVGWLRVLSTWGLGLASVAFAFWAIHHSGQGQVFHWDNRTIGGNTIATRTFFAGACAFFDILNLVQDWEFPTFDSSDIDIYITGTFVDTISCPALSRLVQKFCDVLRLFPPQFGEVFRLNISGKWFAYASVWGSLVADLLCLKSQFTYSPEQFGQYVNPVTQRIWNIVDPHYLDLAYDAGELVRPELVTWEARNPGHPAFNATSASTDVELNARLADSGWRWITLAPGPISIVAFTLVVTRAEKFWESFEHRLRLDHISYESVKEKLERIKFKRLRLFDEDVVRRLPKRRCKMCQKCSTRGVMRLLVVVLALALLAECMTWHNMSQDFQ